MMPLKVRLVLLVLAGVAGLGCQKGPKKTTLTPTALVPAVLPTQPSAMTQAEALAELEALWKLVETFPQRKTPSRHFLHFGLLPSRPGAAPAENELRRKIAARLGANDQPEVAEPARNGERRLRAEAPAPLAPAELARQIGDHARLARVVLEGAPSPLTATQFTVPKDLTDADFIAFLKKLDIEPKRAQLRSLDDAKLEFEDRQAPLFFHSHRFAWERQREQLASWTKAVEGVASSQTRVAQLVRPGMNGWTHPTLWVEAHRSRALTGPWAEAQLFERPIFSPQVGGWTLSILRSAAAEQTAFAPLTWTPTASTDWQTPEDLQREYWLAVGHGARWFDWNGLDPVPSPENPWPLRASSEAHWRMIHQLLTDTAEVEAFIHAVPPRKAQVALLVSLASEMYGDAASIQVEREALYFALRFAHYAVDCLTETDVQTGRLEGYKGLLFVGNHLERATVRPLRLWIENGGAFSVHGGGAFRDEFNQPLDSLDEVLGISEASLDVGMPLVEPRAGLRKVQRLDVIQWRQPGKEFDLDALGTKLRFKAKPTAVVFAKYPDGNPAIIRHDHGQGVTYTYGSYLASSYIRAYLPDADWKPGGTAAQSNHQLPEITDLETGDLIVMGSSEAVYHVVTDNLVVETVVLESQDRLAVVCINWSGTPQSAFLTVQNPKPGFTQARSLKSGPLKLTMARDPNFPNRVSYSFQIKVNVADVVVFE
ncbi:MAG TPA: hypothetical protein PKD86_18610 [Gemmatales bacterium]|mgnify:FL=1|nr:hypothetical protein [Gemmatales bacterium]